MNIHSQSAFYGHNEMQFLTDKDKRNGLLGTIFFHALLVFIFIYFKLNLTFPPPFPVVPEELGMEVNFGNSETGWGEEEPSSGGSPEPENSAVAAAAPAASKPEKSVAKTQEELLTQQAEETARVEAQQKKIAEAKKAEEQKKIEAEKQRVEAEKKKKSDDISKMVGNAFGNGTSESQGINKGPGNQGDPNGTPGSPNYGPGGGSGNIGFSLNGRKMVQRPVIIEKSQDQGKVVVKIIVDRNGKVTKATAGERGTTATSAYLFRISEEAALKTKFDANPATEEQVGTMTFTYKLE
ncbi:MAG: cell envelope integrity protein TolA [Bacteroidia bacterium]